MVQTRGGVLLHDWMLQLFILSISFAALCKLETCCLCNPDIRLTCASQTSTSQSLTLLSYLSFFPPLSVSLLFLFVYLFVFFSKTHTPTQVVTIAVLWEVHIDLSIVLSPLFSFTLMSLPSIKDRFLVLLSVVP